MSHWVDGRIHDAEPPPSSPWQRIVSVLALVCLFDLALGLRPTPAEQPEATATSSTALRETLIRARERAEAGERSILLIGDSVLAGDVLAAERPHDWDSQRVVDHLRRELGRGAGASFEQVALDGLLPIDALHLVAELDRLDPEARVELVVELNLRYFSTQYAAERECARPAICELGEARPDARALVSAWEGVAEAGVRVRDRLLASAPVRRRRRQVSTRPLDQLEGLAVAREPAPDDEQGDSDNDDGDDDQEAEARARVREHYRSARIDPERPEQHAQLEALDALLDRLAVSGRAATLFVTPLEDTFARRSLEAGALGLRYAALARMVNDRGLRLLDFDHPLFVDAHFIDHVHLDVEGARLLAINLLHELGLPLARRPFEAEMIHPEGHDRSLVHRVVRGYAEGGAWQALFDRPDGIAVSHDGSRIVIADTRNHVLRELRGNMQWVETVAGEPNEAGDEDGPARAGATLERPRRPALLGEAVWFIDGRKRGSLRVLERGFVRTPAFDGPRCEGYRVLRADPERRELWALCGDSRVLVFDLERREARIVSELALAPLVSFDLAPDAVYFADEDGRLWSRALGRDSEEDRATLGPWHNLFANTGEALLPHGHRVYYPYAYDELRLAKVVDLRWIERYGGLLVADEFPVHGNNRRLRRELSERVHLRYFDLDAERILPWLAALPHGEAHALYNEAAEQIVSYWHIGSMAIAQDDASLVWLERHRSRLLRIADGLLGVAKSGNHHTRKITVPLLMTVGSVSRAVEAQLRPDRYLDRRHEPLAREGPYVALLVGSSLSSMSDRLSNYSLGRRLELELRRELGYRDRIRLDLFQVSRAAAAFGENVNNFNNWMQTSVPPDVVFIEAHDFGGAEVYLPTTKSQREVTAKLGQLRRLADRYDTLVVFYDLSSIEANRRESMRSTDRGVRELLDQAERLGFLVLDPGDRLFARNLRHAPWGNQPYDHNQHHGAPWAVDITARTLAAMVYPTLREFLRDRVPARLRERPPAHFDRREGRLDPLRRALDEVELDPERLAAVDPAYLQTEFVDHQLRVHVDLAGVRGSGLGAGEELDALAVAVVDRVLREDVYAELAESLRLELVEFRNYDEYGEGVVDSARVRWQREFDRGGLEAFLRAHGPRHGPG